MSNVRFAGSHGKNLSLQEALEWRFVAQEGVHHKPSIEAEAGDEGIQLAFAHGLGVGVAEAEKQLRETGTGILHLSHSGGRGQSISNTGSSTAEQRVIFERCIQRSKR